MARIYGASDDLVEIEGIDESREINCYNRDVTVFLGKPGEGLAVTMRYATSAYSHGWTAEVMQIEGDYEAGPIPWPVTVRSKRDDDPDHFPDYSVIVEVDCPDDVFVWIAKHPKTGIPF